MNTYHLTTEQLTAWLKEINESRQWLAEELRVSIRTVEKWYSIGRIPLSAQRTIQLIKERKDNDSVARPRFTPEEFDSILAAVNATGCDTAQEFIEKAAVRLAEETVKFRKH